MSLCKHASTPGEGQHGEHHLCAHLYFEAFLFHQGPCQISSGAQYLQVSRGAVADEVEGMSTSDTGRGLLISFSWLVRPGMMISMQREYDACGDLMEVRSRSAVEGTWVGGRM